MKAAIDRYINKLNLKVKIILICTFVCILPLLGINLMLNSQLESGIKNEHLIYNESIINQSVSLINSTIAGYISFTEYIAYSKQTYDILSGMNDYPANDIMLKTAELTNSINSIFNVRTNKAFAEFVDINLYLNSEMPEVYRSSITNTARAKYEIWYSEYEQSGSYACQMMYKPWGESEYYYSIVRPINAHGVGYGIVKLDLSLARLVNISSLFNENYSFIISDKNLDEVYFTKGEAGAAMIPQYAGLLKQNGAVYIDGNKILIERDIAGSELKLIVLIDNALALTDISNVRFVQISASILFILITALTAAMFSQQISSRMKLLINKMNIVESGKLIIGAEIGGEDEIAALDVHFNKMVQMLSSLIADNENKARLKRAAELNALRYQINPHFLFNALETINAMAINQGVQHIGEISQRLGDMLRYNLKSAESECVRLCDELEHLRTYIGIQKIRFDNLHISYDVPDELLDCDAVRFMLQPIAENSVKNCTHLPRLDISLKAYRESGKLYIEISDNGEGIDSEKLHKLNAELSQDSANLYEASNGHGLGLKNINNKIKLIMGSEYGICLYSEQNVGTTTKITLPLTRNDEQYIGS